MSQPIATPKSITTSLLSVVAGATLFNAIFWQEKLALNGAIFTVFSIVALLIIYKNALQHRYAKWMLLAVAASLSMVVLYNSQISCIACIAAILLFTAYCKYQHRSPIYAAASTAQSFQYFLPQFAAHLRSFFTHKRKAATAFRQVRFALLPLLLVLLFFFIYVAANAAFANIANKIGNTISQWLAPILTWVQPQRLLFLLLGLLISGGLLYRYFKAPFEKDEATQTDELTRNRTIRRRNYTTTAQSIASIFIGRRAGSALALKYEYKAGIWSLAVLNVLLLAVNATDVVYVWLNHAYTSNFAWAEYVHGGTEILVASILLAMAVVLFFFRGNLNFFRSKKSLQQIAYIWLVQNAFLTASVCLRNYHYITNMGLAYKRIGLFVFIALVLAGLVSVFIKIQWVKSSYYLVKINAIAAVTALVLSACIDWDMLIVKYNLAHQNEAIIDTAFLLTLSDHTLPILQQYRDYLSQPQTLQQQHYYPEYRQQDLLVILDSRIASFFYQQKQYTWLSWNWADAQTEQQLQGNTPLTTVRK